MATGGDPNDDLLATFEHRQLGDASDEEVTSEHEKYKKYVKKSTKDKNVHIPEQLNASSSTRAQLDVLFANTIRCEVDATENAEMIPGQKWMDILPVILAKMDISEQYQNMEHVQNILKTEVPDTVKSNCNQFIEKMEALLTKVDYDLDAKNGLDMKTFESMPRLLCEEQFTSGLEDKVFSALCRLSHIAVTCFGLGTTPQTLHKRWTNFWTSILDLVANQRAKPGSAGFYSEVRVHGDCTLTSNIFDNKDKSHKLVAMPDGLCQVTKCTFEEKTQMILYRAVVMEIKTKFELVHSEASNTWSSCTSSDSSSSVGKCRPKLTTQHFMQLLLAMRDDVIQPDQILALSNKAFGFLAIMNKCFLTGLKAHINGGPMKQRMAGELIRNPTTNKYKLDYKRGNYFQMICLPWLNVFNIEHLRALLAYLQLLIWHVPKTVFDTHVEA